jgi:hypothetical protein
MGIFQTDGVYLVRAGLCPPRFFEEDEPMTDKQVQRLIAAPALAVMLLLFTFHLLGYASAGAAPDGGLADMALIQATTSFTIYGKVISAPNGPGIPGVDVFAWNRREGAGAVSAATLADGAYTLTLAAGDYDLIFNPPCGSGFASQSYKGITGPPDLPLTVPLTIGYTISGTVYATGTLSPVSRTVIYAHNKDTAQGFGLPPANDAGKYCIGLMKGRYDLGFTPPPCLGLGPRTYPITVPEQVISDVILPPGFSVAGCINDRAANLISGVQVYAFDPTPGIGGFGFAPTNETGCYSGTLPSGVFDFQFIPPPWLDLGSVTITDVVSTTAGCPNTSLPITLPPGFTVYGRTVCRGEPVKNVFVFADPVGDPAPGGWGLFSVDDGSYALPLVSDTYEFKFIPPQATKLYTVVITSIDVNTDTMVNADFCPIYLPVVFKNYSPD